MIFQWLKVFGFIYYNPDFVEIFLILVFFLYIWYCYTFPKNWSCNKEVITMGVFVYDCYPFVRIWYLPLVLAQNCKSATLKFFIKFGKFGSFESSDPSDSKFLSVSPISYRFQDLVDQNFAHQSGNWIWICAKN